MEIVDELPDGIELSEHLRSQAAFYLRVPSFGIPYYIPATPKIRRLLGLDARGREAKPDGRLSWTLYDRASALRDIVSALHLQVRDVVLAGIEEDVKAALLERMNYLMTPTVQVMVRKRAALALPEPEKSNNQRKETK